MILDDTPRYARVTYKGPDGKRHRFVGRFTREGNVLRGERKDAGKDDGTILNMFVGDVADVIQVERQDPRYETWEVTTWQ